MANRQNNQTKMLNQPTDWIFCQPLPLIGGSSSSATPPPSPSPSPSTPTRRPSKMSNCSGGGGGTGARRRNSLKRLSVRTRFGRPRPPPTPPPPILSKAAQSLQVVRDDLAKMSAASHFVKPINTISTQTIDQDELQLFGGGSAVSVATAKRPASRIPVRLDRCCKREKEQQQKDPKTAPSGAVNAPPPPPTPTPPTEPPNKLRSSFSRCNIFSVASAPIFEVQLQLIDSLSDRAVTVKPSVARRSTTTFYVVSEASVLACPEIKSRTIDVDSTLENWKPSLAELSVVTGPKTNQKGKSVVKTRKSSKTNNNRDTSRRGRESSPSGKSSSDESLVVDDPDKVRRNRTSAKRSSSKAGGTSDRNDAKSSANDDANGGGGCKAGESDLHGEQTTINSRVHFSPILISSGGGQTKVDVVTKADGSSSSSSPAEGKVAPSEDLVQRVTDQAINKIAKSVMLSLQRRYPSYDARDNAASVSSFSGSYRLAKTSFSSNANSFQSPRPIFSLANNYNDDYDDDDDQYPAFRRNPSHSSVSSLLTGGARARYGGLSTTSLYDVYRPSTVPLSKTRKELDNRYSHSNNIWRSASSTAAAAAASDWLYDGSSHTGYYDDVPYRVNPYPPGGRCGCTANMHLRSIVPSSSSLHYFQEPLRYSKPSDRFSVRSGGGGGGGGGGVAGEGLLQTMAFPRPSAFSVVGKMDGEEQKRASATSVASHPTDIYKKSSRGVQTM